jgi:hypothetical protein
MGFAVCTLCCLALLLKTRWYDVFHVLMLSFIMLGQPVLGLVQGGFVYYAIELSFLAVITARRRPAAQPKRHAKKTRPGGLPSTSRKRACSSPT